MAYDDHENFAISTVASPAPGTAGLTLNVAPGHGARFPTAPFQITVYPSGSLPDPSNAEILTVTAKATDSFTVTRLSESGPTAARDIAVGDIVIAGITVKTFTDLETQKAQRASVSVFTSSGTWTRPTLPEPKVVEAFLIGGGGGGGGGRRGASGTVRGGGGGGCSGRAIRRVFNDPIATLSSPSAVTVGAAGVGGAAATSDNTNGGTGGNGTNTTFGTAAVARGGDAGAGGTSATGGAGGALPGAGQTYSPIQSSGGRGGNGTALPTDPSVTEDGPGGGGGGGGISGGDVDQWGSAGAPGGAGTWGTTLALGGSAGAAQSDGKNPVAGGNAGSVGAIGNTPRPGGGGGGGGSGATSAGSGGTGIRGGGGGGGGASQNGANSGAGGAGGAGLAIVISYF